MTDPNDFNNIYTASKGWRRFLQRRWVGVADIDAEIDAALWEHYTNGVVDQDELFNAVSVTVRRLVRSEQRAWTAQHTRRHDTARSLSATVDGFVFDEDRIVDRLDAADAVAVLVIPDRVRDILMARVNGTTPRMLNCDRVHANRWAQTMRAAAADA